LSQDSDLHLWSRALYTRVSPISWFSSRRDVGDSGWGNGLWCSNARRAVQRNRCVARMAMRDRGSPWRQIASKLGVSTSATGLGTRVAQQPSTVGRGTNLNLLLTNDPFTGGARRFYAAWRRD